MLGYYFLRVKNVWSVFILIGVSLLFVCGVVWVM